MPIVFDEVIGSVEPEPESRQDEQQDGQQQQQADLAALRGQLQRIEQRAERLRAD
jgi:hypothetical protein